MHLVVGPCGVQRDGGRREGGRDEGGRCIIESEVSVFHGLRSEGTFHHFRHILSIRSQSLGPDDARGGHTGARLSGDTLGAGLPRV